MSKTIHVRDFAGIKDVTLHPSGNLVVRHEGRLQPRSENNLRTKFEARGLTYPEGGAA